MHHFRVHLILPVLSFHVLFARGAVRCSDWSGYVDSPASAVNLVLLGHWRDYVLYLIVEQVSEWTTLAWTLFS